jgi:TfdA family taurine catabolism dioxygenase TauD
MTSSELHAKPGERLNDCDPAHVIDLLRRTGWVYFSGFTPSVEDFETFSARFGTCAPTRTVHYPPGGKALGFHAEDAYNPYRPDALWFLCLFEGSDGGAPTGVVDGVRLFAELDDEWRQFCRHSYLRFDRQWPAATWQGDIGDDGRGELAAVLGGISDVTHEFLPDGSLYVGYRAPMVVRTPTGDESFSNTLSQAMTEPSFYGMSLGDGSQVPEELVDLVQRLAVGLEMHLGWTAGDVVVIDNYRMMHRRGEYGGRDRDLRARHGEDVFGARLPHAGSAVAAWAKLLLQGDVAYPTRVGPPTLWERKAVTA